MLCGTLSNSNINASICYLAHVTNNNAVNSRINTTRHQYQKLQALHNPERLKCYQ